MRSIWKGSIAFGLVNVPVKVYSATEDHDIKFHQVHAKDNGRIRYKRVCEVCGEVVEFRDINKAFESDDGQMVVITDEDIATLPEERSREIEVVEFIPADQLDPLMYDKSYFLEPDSKSSKSYVLLAKTLAETERVAIVHFSLRNKTRLAALRVKDFSKRNVMVIHTLLWPDEIRDPDFPVLDKEVEIDLDSIHLELPAENYDAPAEPDIDLPVLPEGGRADQDALERLVPGQIILGQRRALIGQFRLVADQCDRAFEFRLPQRHRRLCPTMAGADNHYIRPFAHPFSLPACQRRCSAMNVAMK